MSVAFTCELCVYAYIQVITLGMELFAFLLLAPLKLFARISESQSSPDDVLAAVANKKMSAPKRSLCPPQPTQVTSATTSKPTTVRSSKPTIVRSKATAASPQPTTPRPTKFTPEALAWEKAVLEAWFSSLRSSDFHSTFDQKMAILRTGNVAGRLAGPKSA
ncbi:hypothetical protein FRC07_000095 [Ceratobasidium sp. 392]|nr:hypothetical protein FRC07_000095 [Ceratobasidium sp. 392]